jgi:branched-chain amino acid transport system ATP-binding protein
MAEPLLAATGLHTYYGASHVLRGVDLTISAGEAVGLMGRNGMGKTTLIRTLVGVLRPRAGRIAVRGDDMTRSAPHEIARRGLAYVPEGRGIFPNLDVREHLLVCARPGVDGRRDWTFDRVIALFPRLGERLGQAGDKLSGGEQQMLSIGRALMTNPDLLILDEATEGLAPLVAHEIWRVLGELRANGIAVVVVDKNHAAVTRLTDRNIILVKGEVVFAGTSAELDRRPDVLERHLGV